MILAISGIGLAVLLSILIPTLFITAVLLLIGLSPCLLVALGALLTKDIEPAILEWRKPPAAGRDGGDA
jgi:hypothetical protein